MLQVSKNRYSILLAMLSVNMVWQTSLVINGNYCITGGYDMKLHNVELDDIILKKICQNKYVN